jgi:hypothetical protein
MKDHGQFAGDVMPVEVHAELKQWSRNIDLYFRRVTVGVSVDVAQPIKWETLDIEQVSMINKPAMSLDREAAQQLMDELWKCGMRPSEGTGSAGSLAATERHLEDMRRLVFKGTEG